MNEKIDAKVDKSTLRMALSILAPFILAAIAWTGYYAFDTAKILTQVSANQAILLKAFDLKPVSSGEK